MILCCGEALIDMLPRESAAGEPAFAPYAGGAVFNTAIALGRLGVPVEFFSGLSTDFFGQMLRDTLSASGVGLRHVSQSPRPSTLAFVRLVQGHATYLFYDENTAGRMLDLSDLPILDQSVDALYFGAISLIPEPCGSTYEALLAREHASRVTMLDPNIRPGFIPDAEGHKARIRRMAANSDIVKLSDEDLRWFSGSDDVEAGARAWLDTGCKLVVITRGRAGATAYTARHRIDVPAQIVTVVDTVGAGDTFNAGVLAALSDLGLLSKPAIAEIDAGALREALAFGARVAAVTVSRAGANPPWRSELA